MKMKSFYCYIGPKSTVSGGLGGLNVNQQFLRKIDSVPTENTEASKNDKNNESVYLKGVDLGNVNLER